MHSGKGYKFFAVFIDAHIPNANVFALYEAGRRYGAYPIRV